MKVGGVTVRLSNGTGFNGAAQGDVLKSVENVIGSTLGDGLIGSEEDNEFTGLGGRDRLDGGTGNDVLVGGANVDLFVIGAGYGVDRASDFTNNLNFVDRVAGWCLPTSRYSPSQAACASRSPGMRRTGWT